MEYHTNYVTLRNCGYVFTPQRAEVTAAVSDCVGEDTPVFAIMHLYNIFNIL